MSSSFFPHVHRVLLLLPSCSKTYSTIAKNQTPEKRGNIRVCPESRTNSLQDFNRRHHHPPFLCCRRRLLLRHVCPFLTIITSSSMRPFSSSFSHTSSHRQHTLFPLSRIRLHATRCHDFGSMASLIGRLSFLFHNLFYLLPHPASCATLHPFS